MVRKILIQYAVITIGCAVYAFGFNWCFAPNHISVGGFTGIGQAAPGLLGKKPQDMTDYESTLMAGLPNAPNVLSADQDAAAARQRLVVRQMEKYGFDPGTAG